MVQSTSRTIRLVALAGVLVCGVTACSTSKSGGTPKSTAGPTTRTSATATTTGGNSGPAKLSDSKYFGLTKLDAAKLCGVMSTSEASGILGKTASAGTFTDTLGLGIICEWKVSGADGLYVGLSTVVDWKGAVAIGQLLTPTELTIDGHPAIAAGPGDGNDYATVDVAVGADHDPAAEFRAPSVATAKALATLVMPRLIALAG